MRQQKRVFYLGLMALMVWLMSVTSSGGAPPQQTGASEKNQPVALPAAKEELLGELSVETGVPGRGIDGAAGSARFGMIRTAKREPAYFIDPASLRFTARAKQGKGWVLVVDGQERGQTFEGIESVVVSPGGQHVVYSAKRAGQWVKMLDDKELGPALEEPSEGIWFWRGVPQHYDSLPDFLLPSFLAIAARRGGSRVSGLDEVDLPVFSADGQHLAYWARRAKKREFIVLDGKEGPEFEKVGAPHISPDGQPLAYAYDMLGRVTSATDPESGTTTYTYDSIASGDCAGNYKGDLIKRFDAAGNVTCYAYDSLHRLKDVTYPTGSYASVTAQKHFVYDAATVNSVVMSNAKARLAEAYTGTSGSKITDLGFSYSARGEDHPLHFVPGV